MSIIFFLKDNIIKDNNLSWEVHERPLHSSFSSLDAAEGMSRPAVGLIFYG